MATAARRAAASEDGAARVGCRQRRGPGCAGPDGAGGAGGRGRDGGNAGQAAGRRRTEQRHAGQQRGASCCGRRGNCNRNAIFVGDGFKWLPSFAHVRQSSICQSKLASLVGVSLTKQAAQ
ncbi:hypothetical protein PR202_gb00294 [Eleusine coracana subsp. coracana]|uniref:Uncharacterized protein n=1 Tax=Eleusine coracana subsp. coracana TaxID=191504 RepID=A0AAV5DR66_ELECO|nr:hypothetical protein PR202_gb00294 [Eleusine coracana subsp. coracana]